MVWTRSQLNDLTREELIEELLKFNDLAQQISNLNEKLDRTFSQLEVSKTCNSLLNKRLVSLERTCLDNAQYLRREMIEVNPVPSDIPDNELEEKICHALSLTGVTVTPDDLDACHRLKNKNNVIIKFKSRKVKQRVTINRRNLKNKATELSNLKFTGNLFINESMCSDNHKLFYKCRKLKKAKKIHSTWFFNNSVNIQINQDGNIHRVFHTYDLEELLNIEYIDNFIARI